jgi:hypothetical protein
MMLHKNIIECNPEYFKYLNSNLSYRAGCVAVMLLIWFLDVLGLNLSHDIYYPN